MQSSCFLDLQTACSFFVGPLSFSPPPQCRSLCSISLIHSISWWLVKGHRLSCAVLCPTTGYPVIAKGVKRLYLDPHTHSCNPAILSAPQLDSSHPINPLSVAVTVRTFHCNPLHSRLIHALPSLHAVSIPFSWRESVNTSLSPAFITPVRGAGPLPAAAADPCYTLL